MKNHSRHTPFRMCVVALFFVLAWWRVFMTNSLPAKIARKLQANRNFWKAAAILKPVGRELGWFQPRFEKLWTLTGDKAWWETKTKQKRPSSMWIQWPSKVEDKKVEAAPYILLMKMFTYWGGGKTEDKRGYPFVGRNRASLGGASPGRRTADILYIGVINIPGYSLWAEDVNYLLIGQVTCERTLPLSDWLSDCVLMPLVRPWSGTILLPR